MPRQHKALGLYLAKFACRRYLWLPLMLFLCCLLLPLGLFSQDSPSGFTAKTSTVRESSNPADKNIDSGGVDSNGSDEKVQEGGPFLRTPLFQVIGGLGLFLFGLRLMSDGLQKVVGDRMKRVLATLTERPVYGLLLGTVITGIIQSSSATTVMVVGFINAGLMDFVQSIGVIIGANLGTTITTQIVALSLDQWALPAIGLGMVLHLFFKDSRIKDSGLVLLGFGMLFLGLVFMKQAIPPEAQNMIKKLFLLSSGDLRGIFIGLTVGTIATALVQSSSVTVSIIVVLASQGMVADLRGAIPLILGCNIGTCVTAFIASIGANVASKRAVATHIFFNVFGAVLTLSVFYHFYLWIIPAIGGGLAHEIANLHVMIKLVDALLFLPIVRPFSRFISSIVAAKEVEKPGIEIPHYLDDKFLKEPVVATELATKEVIRLGHISQRMVKYAMDGFMYNYEDLLNRAEEHAAAVQQLRQDILAYVIRIAGEDLDKEEAERIPKLILSMNNFDRVAGHAIRLLELGRTKVSKNIPLVQSALKELRNTYREVDSMLSEVGRYLPQFKR